jgi:hypothetical protein
MRDGFRAIVSGWTLSDSFYDITERIERAAEWAKVNGPLEPEEVVTIKEMIACQLVRGDAEDIEWRDRSDEETKDQRPD